MTTYCRAYGIGNSTQGTVVAWMGRRSERERTYACVWLTHFAVCRN